MNYLQEVIVFLWLVPVLGLVVLPILWSIVGLLYRAIERSRLQDIQGFISLNNRDASRKGEAEGRNRPRIHLDEGRAFISHKGGCWKALVSDISKQGICLKNVPEKMYRENGPFRVVFRTKEKDYAVTARPIWKRPIGTAYIVGAEIDRIPRGWKELVNGLTHSLSLESA